MTQKRRKAEGKTSPKILLEKNKERKNGKSEEKERRKRKHSNGFTLILGFERKTVWGENSILAVTLFKNAARYIFFSLINKGYVLINGFHFSDLKHYD